MRKLSPSCPSASSLAAPETPYLLRCYLPESKSYIFLRLPSMFCCLTLTLFRLPLNDGPFQETASSIIPDLEASAFPVNLIHIETPEQHFAAFLSIGWGLLGDIGWLGAPFLKISGLDIESEKFRRLFGSGRFFVGAILRLISKYERKSIYFRPPNLSGSVILPRIRPIRADFSRTLPCLRVNHASTL